MTATMRRACDVSPNPCHCLAQFSCRELPLVETGPTTPNSRQRQLSTLKHTVLRLASAGLFAGAVVFLALGVTNAAAQDREGWPDSLIIGTETEGSAYALYGDGMAELLNGDLGVEVSTSLTGGAFQNAALMQTGDLDLGLIAVGPMYEAWGGRSPLSPTLPHDQLRALFPVFSTTFQMMTLDGSEINGPDGLGGTTVGSGPASGASGIYVPRFFETLGIEIEPRNGETEDLALQLRHGLISGLAVADGMPIPAFIELGPDDPSPHLLTLTNEQQAALLDAFPFLVAASIPAGTYPDQSVDIETVAMWHFMVARADLPEELVYQITKTSLEYSESLARNVAGISHAQAEDIIQNAIVPLHPGAVRYYEEIGLEIPEELKAW